MGLSRDVQPLFFAQREVVCHCSMVAGIHEGEYGGMDSASDQRVTASAWTQGMART